MAIESMPLGAYLFILTQSVFWASITVLRLIWAGFRRGFSQMVTPKTRTRPQCLDDPIYGEHTFIKLREVSLHCMVAGPEGAPLMLFLHGFPESWYSWRYQIKAFADTYRTVAVDMRGYGDSDKPKGVKSYHLSVLADDIQQLVEALGYERCVLVAHDWGGLVATVFTELHPEMVHRFILLNIPHMKIFKKHFDPMQFIRSWYIYMFQLPWLAEFYVRSFDYEPLLSWLRLRDRTPGSQYMPCQTEEDLQVYKYVLQEPSGGLTCRINYYRALFQFKPPQLPQLLCKVPTLLIWGVHDRYLGKGMADASAEAMEDFTLHFIQTAGHWVQMEEPDKVSAAIRNFLNRDN